MREKLVHAAYGLRHAPYYISIAVTRTGCGWAAGLEIQNMDEMLGHNVVRWDLEWCVLLLSTTW